MEGFAEMLKEKTHYKEGLPVSAIVANIKEYPIHFHDDIEVVYVLSGSVFLKNGYYTFLLKPGDVFVINDKEMHSFYKTEEDNMVMMLQLDITYFTKFYEDFRNCFFVTNMNDEMDDSLDVPRAILARLMLEILQKGPNYEHKVIEGAHNLISSLIADFQYFAMEDGRFVNEAKNKENKVLAGRLRRITDYMYENYMRKLTLGEIAQREHLSVFYLSHAIKEATGLSFQNLLSFIRVEESEKILLGTSKKIGAISEACGFSAVRYYVKHFQTWFGEHPLEYRRKYAGKVSSREITADYEKCQPNAIEEILRKQLRGSYSVYNSEGKPDPVIINLDMAECATQRKPKMLFPEEMFEKDVMKAAARPYTLFKNLHEQVLLSEPFCMISTSAPSRQPPQINNISILIYNYDETLQGRITRGTGQSDLLDLMKGFDKEAEILVRCAGLSGDFNVVRYKVTRENIISASADWSRLSGTLNKRQAIINSWRSLPNIESGEISVSDTLNLRFVFRGLSAELILIDRK